MKDLEEIDISGIKREAFLWDQDLIVCFTGAGGNLWEENLKDSDLKLLQYLYDSRTIPNEHPWRYEMILYAQ